MAARMPLRTYACAVIQTATAWLSVGRSTLQNCSYPVSVLLGLCSHRDRFPDPDAQTLTSVRLLTEREQWMGLPLVAWGGSAGGTFVTRLPYFLPLKVTTAMCYRRAAAQVICTASNLFIFAAAMSGMHAQHVGTAHPSNLAQTRTQGPANELCVAERRASWCS